ncbi:MAG: hypothetical protein QM723_17025 [Myxococcaceae bacterium]
MRLTVALLALSVLGCGGTTDGGTPDGGVDGGHQPPPHLVLSEASAAITPGTPAWVELFNGTSQAIDLSGYKLRSGLLLDDGGVESAGSDFTLPMRSLAPGGFIVASGKPFADLYESPQLMLLGTPGASFYFTADGGPSFVQLYKTSGELVDAVSFGAPVDGWSGAGAPLPSAPTDFGRVLARHLDRDDTNSAADWAVCEFSTPAGANDAFDPTDQDLDGLPDSAERSGGTFAGIPLYDLGARTGERDVFVEIDWMSTDGGPAPGDPGVTPRVEALDQIRKVFAGHGITLHFDVGARAYLDGGELPLGSYDLGGGNELPFACTLTMSAVPGAQSFYELKANNFDLRRRPSFHYVVFGNSIADVSCGDRGATGRAEEGGNDIEISLGTGLYHDDTQNRVNQVINVQSATLMHELGHNFGLRHGGSDDVGYKPNYLSVMNYLYQLVGLPVIGTNEGDRYYWFYGGDTGLCSSDPPAVTGLLQLTQGPAAAPGTFRLDYSDGSGAPLDQSALDETKGLGRTGSTGVDFNWNGMIDATPVSADIDSAAGSPTCPLGSNASGVLRDFDDWSAITLPFTHSSDAQSGASLPRVRFDLMGDRQPEVVEPRLNR